MSGIIWRHNVYGQIGDNTNTNRLVPTDVEGLGSNVMAVSAGNFTTCALTTAGDAKCWGSNNNGQLGNGSTTSSRIPVDVTGLETAAVAIVAGGDHGCVVDADGRLSCWGGHQYGGLGIGGRSYSEPGEVLVPNLPERDASLSALSLTIPFGFVPETTHYTLTVDHAVDAIAFTPTAANPSASLTLGGQPIDSGETSSLLPLAVGSNPFVVGVLAADGVTRRDYAVEVVRLSEEPARLEVRIDPPDGPLAKGGGALREYRVNVVNIGQGALRDVSVSVPAVAGLTDVVWTCETAYRCTPLAGEGAVIASFDLPPGGWAYVDLMGWLPPDLAFVGISAQAGSTAGGGVDGQARVNDPVNGIGLMKGGFED